MITQVIAAATGLEVSAPFPVVMCLLIEPLKSICIVSLSVTLAKDTFVAALLSYYLHKKREPDK